MNENPDHIVVTRTLTVPLSELTFEASRSAGPGGQNVNKVNSRVQMRWAIADSDALTEEQFARFERHFGNRINGEGVFVIASQEFRKQKRNRERCIEKLTEMLAQIAATPKQRRKTKPTRGSQRRRLAAKKRHSEKKSLRRAPKRDESR